MADELAGFPSRELGRDPITGRRGSNQFLGDAANHHNGTSTVGPGGNKIRADASRLPAARGSASQTPSALSADTRVSPLAPTDNPH